MSDRKLIAIDAAVALGINENGGISLHKQLSGSRINSAPDSIRELISAYKQFGKYVTLDVIPDYTIERLIDALDECGYLSKYKRHATSSRSDRPDQTDRPDRPDRSDTKSRHRATLAGNTRRGAAPTRTP